MLKDLKIFKLLVFMLWLLLGIFAYKSNFTEERVIFLDVGQGDSILIQKGEFEILIDGGGDDSVVYKMGKYMKWDDRVIDIVLITHMHDDHYRGIKYLMERYEIGLFLISPNCGELCSEFREYNFKEISKDMVFKYEDIQFNILWPRVGIVDKNINNDSIVLYLKYLDNSFLLMGDAEREVEEVLLDSYRIDITDLDILKAGHHCSRTASTESFLSVIDPQLAICSCGEENKFGHPHQETLKSFEELNIKYYITWEEGDYVVK